jgi:hypothetical protein
VTILSYALVTTSANPWDPGSCTCHSSNGYSIWTGQKSTLDLEPYEYFTIDIGATGDGVIVQFHRLSRDNRHFSVLPIDIVVDGDIYDSNSQSGIVNVTFTFQAPEKIDEYTILIYARSPGSGQPQLACVEFQINVGASNPSLIDNLDRISNHWAAYFGIAIVFFTGLGTIIYEKNHHKTRPHAILTSIGLGLATINAWLIFPRTFALLSLPSNIYFINWAFGLHLAFGWIGLFLGWAAFISGIGGIRTKIPGYLALGCWCFNLIFGILYWGFIY